jgi:hypothetical protein
MPASVWRQVSEINRGTLKMLFLIAMAAAVELGAMAGFIATLMWADRAGSRVNCEDAKSGIEA